MKVKKIVFAILLVTWMITVFMFSNESSEESSGTSGNTIRAIINIIPSIRNMETNEKEEIVKMLQPIARKLAHFTIYTIGGILAFLNVNEYNSLEKRKVIYCIIFGLVYAATDEMHQMLVPRKKRGDKRCSNRHAWSKLGRWNLLNYYIFKKEEENMNKKVVIIGAGGHAKVISEIVELNGDMLIGFLDDTKKESKVIGTTNDINKILNSDNDIKFIIGIGNNKVRNDIFKAHPQIDYYTAIHPRAVISKSAIIGKGSAIMANAVINANSIIDENCIINTGTIVEHDCKIENGAHLSYRVTVGSESKIGEGVLIDRNVKINDYEKISIGEIVRGED